MREPVGGGVAALLDDALELLEGLDVAGVGEGSRGRVVVLGQGGGRHVERVQLGQVVNRRPTELVAERDRGVASSLELAAVREQSLQAGRRSAEAGLLEGGLVVHQVLGVQVDRYPIVLALVLESLQCRRGEGLAPLRGGTDHAGQVRGQAATDELVGEVAGPGKVDVRQALGRRKHPDLVLVRLVADLLEVDLHARIGALVRPGHIDEEGGVLGVGELGDDAERAALGRRACQVLRARALGGAAGTGGAACGEENRGCGCGEQGTLTSRAFH